MFGILGLLTMKTYFPAFVITMAMELAIFGFALHEMINLNISSEKMDEILYEYDSAQVEMVPRQD